MFRDRYLPVYQAALEAGAATVMSAFNDFDGIPASGNKWLLKTVLRDELGFDGFVVSDYDAVHEMVNHGVAADGTDAARLALEAWLDMEMTSGDYINHGEQLVREGLVSEKHIDNLCRNILIAKYELGLFEDPFRYGGEGRLEREAYKPESMDLARRIARESMVLLKNDGAALPLKEGAKVAMIGPFLSDARAMNGTWDGFSEAARTVTIEKGLKARFPEGSMSFTRGCDPYNHISGGVEAAVRAARAADVAVLTLGLPGNHSGETTSMTSVELPQAQKDLLAAVKAVGKPVVVLLVTGRPMALESVDGLMDALLVVWHPGTMGGHAVADLLSGDFSPSGHLTMSFPRCDGQIPIRYNYKSTGRPLNKEIDYTQSHKAKKNYLSSYLFTPNNPLYPFGYGLSYTEFEFSDLQVLDPEVGLGEDVGVSVRVTNAGDVKGTTVAQLYIRDMVASTTRPVRELKGFKRVSLEPGASAEVVFTVTAADMAFCREDMKFAQEPGKFGVWVGENCEAELEGSFIVKE
jgi:beta-glucosidase